VKVPRKAKAWVAILVALSGALVAWMARNERAAEQTAGPRNSATSPAATSNDSPRAKFDFYLLAVTLHPAFCADGHERKAECRSGTPVPLSIHGLWPERLAHGQYPRDCAGPRLDLEPPLESDLASLMPGMADGLHEHEWRTHGTCSGLNDDEYFRHTLEMARRLDAVFRDHLTTLAGRTSSVAELRAFADSRQPGLGASLTFHCRTLRGAPVRGEPYLVEIRQCVDDDGPGGAPGTLLSCEDWRRVDQGCGRSFHIAETARR
jgi:ribonuclease T2